MSEIRPSASLADMIRDYEPHRVIEGGRRPAYEHIVSWSASWIARLLRRPPRALCGELLWGDPDLPNWGTPPDAPYCPDCLERNGSDTRPLTRIPGGWL